MTTTDRPPAVGNVVLDRIEFHPHNVRVNLGDLRDLVASIREFGVMQPVVLERRGEMLRVRTGHRRVAAARQAGLTRIPAIVHRDALAEPEWLASAVHENTRRRGMDAADRARTVKAMRSAGMKWQAIAYHFDTTIPTVKRWLDDETPTPATATDAKTAVKQARPKRRPPQLVSAKRLRADLDECRAAVTAGELDVWGVLNRIEALLPDDNTQEVAA